MARKQYVKTQSGTIIETDRPDLWPEAEPMKRADAERALEAESRKYLLSLLKPGDTVYCVRRHVSGSGMSRRIDLFTIKKNKPILISGDAARVMGKTHHAKGGIEIGGCGMDMGFAMVYNLGAALWPKGTPRPHSTRNGEPNKEGGYALHSQWL